MFEETVPDGESIWAGQADQGRQHRWACGPSPECPREASRSVREFFTVAERPLQERRTTFCPDECLGEEGSLRGRPKCARDARDGGEIVLTLAMARYGRELREDM